MHERGGPEVGASCCWVLECRGTRQLMPSMRCCVAAQVVVVRQEGVSGRGSKAREEAGVQINRPPSISTGSPYLGKTSSRRLSRSASASGAASTPLSSTSSGLPVGPLAPAGNHTPRGTSSKVGAGGALTI